MAQDRKKWKIRRSTRTVENSFKGLVCHVVANVFYNICCECQKKREAERTCCEVKCHFCWIFGNWTVNYLVTWN